MSHRFIQLALVGVAALTPVLAQTAAAPSSTKLLAAKEGAKTWSTPKTVDGVPDISGVFTNSSAIPLERPKDLGAKEYYTKEEQQAVMKRAEGQKEVVAPGTYGDVHYSMAQFGLEKGQSAIAASMRTSMIVPLFLAERSPRPGQPGSLLQPSAPFRP